MTRGEEGSRIAEEWMIMPHVLSPGIPASTWILLSLEEQNQLYRREQEKYNRIEKQQWEYQENAAELKKNFKELPIWRKIPCWLGFHDIEFNMENQNLGRPDTFMRIIYCRTCGAQFYRGPLGLRKMRS